MKQLAFGKTVNVTKITQQIINLANKIGLTLKNVVIVDHLCIHSVTTM
jgi:hypothetical protein